MGDAPASVSRALDEPIRALVEASVERAKEAGQTRWVAFVVDSVAEAHPGEFGVEAIDCYAWAGKRDRFLFSRGDSGDWSVGWGVADEIESAGPSRFRDVRVWKADLLERIDWLGDARAATAATFFGGFGFEPESRGSAEWKSFPAARFVLPRVIVECRGEVRTRVLIARVEPAASVESIVGELLALRSESERAMSEKDRASEAPQGDVVELPASPRDWPVGPEYRVRADRAHAVFCAQVESALDASRRGLFSKVVLARSLSIDHDGDLDVPAFLSRLRALYPTCTLIAMGRGDDTFLAATPEILIRVKEGEVETAALAGSAPRGRHPEEDRAFASRLMASAKERSEHALVVEAIHSVLDPACQSLQVPDQPTLRPLFGIQHLETPIRGRLKAPAPTSPTAEEGDAADRSTDVLDLVEALHPTPAVGGFPSAAASDWLHRFEGLDRGWYAGPIGFLDSEGGGDFRVALRSGLIRNGLGAPAGRAASRALLFAGAGIVEGSVPEEELVETRIKLRALLAPLTEI